MKTLAQLVKEIRTQIKWEGNEDVRDLKSIFSSYQQTDWSNYLEFENGSPKNSTLYQDAHVKMILIYWKPKQKSSKHGHPAGGGLIQVLSGSLLETRFAPHEPDHQIGQEVYTPDGDISYIHDSEAFHVVENPSDEPAVSLHLYSTGLGISSFLRLEKQINQTFQCFQLAA